MKITDFINGPVTYDKFGGQYFWITDSNGGQQMLAEMRGWGHIQNMFKKEKDFDLEAAGKFQDEVGNFVAEAINEKIKRDSDQKKCDHYFAEGAGTQICIHCRRLKEEINQQVK